MIFFNPISVSVSSSTSNSLVCWMIPHSPALLKEPLTDWWGKSSDVTLWEDFFDEGKKTGEDVTHLTHSHTHTPTPARTTDCIPVAQAHINNRFCFFFIYFFFTLLPEQLKKKIFFLVFFIFRHWMQMEGAYVRCGDVVSSLWVRCVENVSSCGEKSPTSLGYSSLQLLLWFTTWGK